MHQSGKSAMKEHNVQSLNTEEVREVVQKMAAILSVSVQELSSYLLGSSRNAFSGKTNYAGDVDIAWPIQLQPAMHEHIVHVLGDGKYSAGICVGSYPLTLSSGKVTQVDLMYVKNQKWAVTGFYSDYGVSSKYKGAVRNILLAVLTSLMQQTLSTKVTLTDEDGVIAESKMVYKNTDGIIRTFKCAKIKKDGSYSKTLETCSPERFNALLKERNSSVVLKPVVINDPDSIARYLFLSDYVSKDDIMTVENIISAARENLSCTIYRKFCELSKNSILAAHMEVPEEISLN